MKISSPRVSSGSASQTTLKRRSTELLEVRKRVSGGEDVLQLSNEVKTARKTARKEDREKLVEELKRTTGFFHQIKFSVAARGEPWDSIGLDDTVSQAADHEDVKHM